MHCVAIVAKADQRANIILHCFVSWYHNLLAKTFVVYVGPVLEYNSVIMILCVLKKNRDALLSICWGLRISHTRKGKRVEPLEFMRLGTPSVTHRLYSDCCPFV